MGFWRSPLVARTVRRVTIRNALDVKREMNEADGRLDVRELPDGFVVEIETRNTIYRIDRAGAITSDKRSGRFAGCTLGGSMLYQHHVFIGGHAEFTSGSKKYTSTPIQRVDVVQ